MNARRGVMFVGFALVMFGSRSAPSAAPDKDAWTPDRVREFVIHVEAEMSNLMDEQLIRGAVPSLGTCRGFPIGYAIRKSVAMPRIQALVTGKALTCYVASYLGCNAGNWIAGSSEFLVVREPFTRSKVTIIEQTADRVVADVAETTYPETDDDFVARVALPEDSEETHRPFTDAEVAAVKDFSRYTITRGDDGIWRISDRKPSFKWVCNPSSIRPSGRK